MIIALTSTILLSISTKPFLNNEIYSNSMIKAIAVDFGGVYFTFDSKKFEKELARAAGVDVEAIRLVHAEKIRDLHVQKISEKKFWNHLGKKTGRKVDHKIMRTVVDNHCKPVMSVIRLMKKLRKNYKIILLTNNTVALDRLNKKYKFYKNFDYVISSHVIRMQKPYKNIYKLLINKAKCKPNEILFIDDLERNLKPAKYLGMKTILFENSTQLKKKMISFGI